jgi:cellulose biosynthesis protein BcsQ
MLSEEERDNSQDSIYKYQSVECIIREIISFGGNSDCGTKELEVIGVYSPAGVRFKTQFALNLSGVLAQQGKTLYINLEEYSGLDEMLAPQNGYNLSDVLYYYRQSKGKVTQQMKEAVCSRAGLDYLAPSVCPEDITYVGEEQIADMAKDLGKECGYRTVVLDISSFVKEQWRIIYYCDCIYMPVEENYLMHRKQVNFDTYILNSRAEEIADRIKKINLPEGTAELSADYLEREDREMKQYVRGLL